MNNIVNVELVEKYLTGRTLLLKPPSARSHEERKLLKSWLLERVYLFSTLQLDEGMHIDQYLAQDNNICNGSTITSC